MQARDSASYDDCVEQVRGILRTARKVPPGEDDDFELFSNDSLIEQFNTFTRAVRFGVAETSAATRSPAQGGLDAEGRSPECVDRRGLGRCD